jgi:hypothetical protein
MMKEKVEATGERIQEAMTLGQMTLFWSKMKKIILKNILFLQKVILYYIFFW